MFPNIMWLQRTKDDNIFMVFYFFSVKWRINPNGTLHKCVVKTKIRSLNIMFLDRFLCRITTRGRKSLFLHENLNTKKIEIFTFLRFHPNVPTFGWNLRKKNFLLTLKKKAHWPLILGKTWFFGKYRF